MKTIPKRLIPTAAILAMLAIATSLLLLPTQSASIDWNGDSDDLGEWVRTGYAASFNHICAQHNSNDECTEWCDNTPAGLEPSGLLCCVGPNGVCYAHNTFQP